jgi:hypothetical protein
MAKQKKRAKERKLRPERAWVPVSPEGFVCWHRANCARGYAMADVAGGTQNWPQMYRLGWRIVRCRVEK